MVKKTSKTQPQAQEELAPSPDSPLYAQPKSVEEMAQGFSVNPDNCGLWKQQQFRPRVWLAVADWSGQPPNNLRPDTKLGSLVPLWGIGEQNRLVQTTNQHQVFAPFASSMAPPNTLLPAETTVLQWENVVWTFQTPRTPCWGTP
jgi:hypothetical protein